LVKFFDGGGGRIEVAICNWAGELDRTARLPMSTTQQSTSERGVGGWNGRGMVWQHCLSKGILVEFFCGGGRIEVVIWDRAGKVDRTARSPPQQYHNQQLYAEVGAGMAWGWRGGIVFLLRPVPCLKNMTINQCAPGCGLERPGEGAVAQRSRSKIDNIHWGGGGGIAFIFCPGGLNRTIHLVAIADNMTIKHRTTGFGLKQPGDGVVTSFFEGDFGRIFFDGGR